MARWAHPAVFTGGGDVGPMKEDTSRFLKFYSRALPESAVCVVTFLCNSKRPPITKFLTPAELLTFDEYPDFYNAYIRTTALKSVPGRGRGTKADTLGSSLVWLDFDSYKVSGLSQVQALQKLKAMVPPPSCIINSGHGLQAWWKLHSFSMDTIAIESASKHVALSIEAGGDHCWDLARVLRIPGTMNFKNEPAVPVELLELNDSEYSLDAFDVLSLDGLDATLRDRILTEETARDAGAEIKPDGHVDRSRNDAWITTRLLGLGYSKETVTYTLTHPTWFSGQRHTERPETTYVEATVKNAATFAEGKEHFKFVASDVSKLVLQRLPTLSVGGAPYVYNNGVFRYDASRALAKCIQDIFGPLWRANWHDAVVKWILDHTAVDPEVQSHYTDLVNVRNGMLNIYDGSLTEHDTSYQSFVQLPIVYNEEAKSQKVLDFAASIVAEDALPTFWEFMGFLLLPDYRYKRVLLLIGPGNTGKSSLLEFIRRALGRMNTSSISLQDLTENSFMRVELFGKMANIYADLSLNAIESSGEVKALTGGDEIEAHRKYGQPFTFRNAAKLIFSANDFSSVSKPDPTFFDRFIVISCTHKFVPGKDAIVNIVETFSPDDYSAFLNYALGGLRRLIAHQGFTVSEMASVDVQEMKQEFKESADNIVAFIVNATQAEQGAMILKADMYAVYRQWCERAGVKPVSSIRFYKRVKQGLDDFGMSAHYILQKSGAQSWMYEGRSIIGGGEVDADGVVHFSQPT
jgi:P4 family phage/plasmid primase-like protien